MKTKRLLISAVLLLISLVLVRLTEAQMVKPKTAKAKRLTASDAAPVAVSSPLIPRADSPVSPTTPVKLIFIHHSTGGNWLADPNGDQSYGGLGRALMDNNYFVSATNYGWGPDQIGSNTDIGYWWDWFRGPNHVTYTTALYNEDSQNICNPTADPPYECFGLWPRLPVTPTGENEIVMFKGCFPNAHLSGSPTDDPTTGDNPLRGQSAWIWDDDLGHEVPNPNHTVANAKGIYNDILQYFAEHQDKLFIVITGPPLASDDMSFSTDAAHAANYRAFNEWLVNDWLDSNSYTHTNVAVFDYYNVLTSNNGNPETNDAGLATGNHHRWWNNAVQHVSPVDNDFSAYAMWQDSHPTTAGQQKATAEFVPLLNVYYNRWQGGGTACTPLTGVSITGPTTGYTNTAYTFHAAPTPSGASTPITYTWDPAPDSGQRTGSAIYTWAATGTQTITLTAENCDGSGSDADTYTITIQTRGNYRVYLPLVLRDYGTAAPSCPAPLTGVTISGDTTGYTDTLYTFHAAIAPSNATTPIAYTWSPAPESGQGTASASYQWDTTGSKTVNLSASNCTAAHTATDTHVVTIQAAPSGDLIQPSDLTYLGAFRLPDMEPGTPATLTWEYSGQALTYRPDGDPGGDGDGYPGSLFGTGHNVLNYVSEIDIPAPISSTTVISLNNAETIQDLADVRGGLFDTLAEMPRVGIQYLPTQTGQTSAKLHLAWGAHHQDEGSPTHTPSHAWCDLTLSEPNTQGAWWMGATTVERLYRTNDYIFEIPSAWADAHLGGAKLATGRYRDGGWSGMGPNIFAYGPWIDDSSLVSGTILTAHELLAYSYSGGDYTLDYYHDSDDWTGGAWLTASTKSAVVFVGTKGGGDYWWYGYASPAGDGVPCVWFPSEPWEGDPACFKSSDGSSCVADFPAGSCTDYVEATKGWWSSRADAQIIFYDPADLAAVQAGTMEPYEPQPYARLDIDDHLFLDWPASTETDCGSGDQRKCRTGAVAYDRERGFLYILELFADEAKPVVHVWQVQ